MRSEVPVMKVKPRSRIPRIHFEMLQATTVVRYGRLAASFGSGCHVM